jgi:23S rRNA (cytidine1920-2'-O)/16S rRNA (cytidine1409-2'-O)-methyltransferase
LARGLCATRTQAQGFILSGQVLVNHQVADKPGLQVLDVPETLITVQATCRYVSRGGLKLEKALQYFNVDPTNTTCLDVGASTGGFTDCLLQHGANRVIAVDVGYNQLDWRLRQDDRVSSFEKTNARLLTPDSLNILLQSDTLPNIGLMTMDVAFISILKLLGPVKALLNNQAQAIVLLKPQFEYQEAMARLKADPNTTLPSTTGRFDGIVRNPADRAMVLDNVVACIGQQTDWTVAGCTESPIVGAKGNVEYLLHLTS